MTDQILSEAFIENQRQRLLAMQREVLGGEKTTISAGHNQEAVSGEEAKEFEGDAQKMEQDIANQALRNVNDHKVAGIQRALEKIAEGTYGHSDKGGEPIPIKRLKILPESILTVQEESERDAGR
ncbi:MAG: TraR/DksA family transcriptional regulator [Paraburkholderia tropica]|uniref:TraR/DksA family transcriptional regulator n=1 Tax=Paraburkholderia tropica TaxID=92647 RepID=UPI002AB72037|nr:TraR/DksA family transcriptional regulator [Paraburkholderia tropica]